MSACLWHIDYNMLMRFWLKSHMRVMKIGKEVNKVVIVLQKIIQLFNILDNKTPQKENLHHHQTPLPPPSPSLVKNQ